MEAAGGNWSDIDRINRDIEQLRAMQWPVVRMADFPMAKVAWKVAAFSQVGLHRVVALADAATLAWNAGAVIGAILCVRSLIETVALIADFEGQITRIVSTGRIEDIDDLVMNRNFANKLGWHAPTGKPEQYVPTNILTLVTKLDRTIPGVKSHYSTLSEICHPNALGTHSMFSELRAEEHALYLGQAHGIARGGLLSHMLPGVGLAGFVRYRLEALQAAMPEIVRLNRQVPLAQGRR